MFNKHVIQEWGEQMKKLKTLSDESLGAVYTHFNVNGKENIFLNSNEAYCKNIQ